MPTAKIVTAMQYQVLRRLGQTDPPHVVAKAYEGKSKLEVLLGALLADVSGKVIVDFGCGEGLEAIELAQRGAARVYGVDTNPTASRWRGGTPTALVSHASWSFPRS